MSARPSAVSVFGSATGGPGRRLCHHHTGIGLHTPADVHYGLAAATNYAAWINPPTTETQQHKTVQSRRITPAGLNHLDKSAFAFPGADLDAQRP